MAERGIGTVKQTIRCLLLESKMERASWPVLLPEVSFLLNNVSNASTKLSPHMLTFGRQPKVPTDVKYSVAPVGTSSPEEYLQQLDRTKEVLSDLARINTEQNSIVSKNHYDVGKRDARCKVGETVLLRKEMRGALDCRYEGPYTILRRSGENVKLSLPENDKWVHLNRCKAYEKSKLATPASSQVEDMGGESGGIDTKCEDPWPASDEESGSTPGQSLELEPYRDLQQKELSDDVMSIPSPQEYQVLRVSGRAG